VTQVLFVCSGNICRSPMAHHLFAKLLNDRSVTHIQAASCGTYKIGGQPSMENTLAVLHKYGADGDTYRSTAMHYYHLTQSHLIIAMEPLHVDMIREEAGDDPEIMKKVFVITEFHPDPVQRNAAGIYDFYLAPLDTYQELGAEIWSMLQNILNYCLEQWPAP